MTMAAIEDAERLARWIEPNAWALQDEAVEAAVLRALGEPVPADLAGDVPLLRFANGRAPMSLLDAVLDPPIPRYVAGRHFRCDVAGTQASQPNTIWIPCGRSVVQLTVRNFTRELMQDDNRADLVWWD